MPQKATNRKTATNSANVLALVFLAVFGTTQLFHMKRVFLYLTVSFPHVADSVMLKNRYHQTLNFEIQRFGSIVDFAGEAVGLLAEDVSETIAST